MSDTQKRLYEISFLLQKEEDVTEVAQLLEEHGATVTDEGEVKKLAFAYPIDRISEGYFGYLHATIDPIKAKEIEEEVGLKKNIIRLLILRVEIKKKATKKRSPQKREETKPLTNEELEQKIEELSAKL